MWFLVGGGRSAGVFKSALGFFEARSSMNEAAAGSVEACVTGADSLPKGFLRRRRGSEPEM